MISIKVSGGKASETGEFIEIINRALQAAGKRTTVAATGGIVSAAPGRTDCVVVERPLPETTKDPKKFDFLIGLTEAAAYEIAQDNGFVVRIWTRNGIPMVSTRDVKADRVNLAIAHNIVVGWYIG